MAIIKIRKPLIILFCIGLAGAAYHMLTRPDFNDNPAILRRFEKGAVTLKTYNGEIMGVLADVTWNDFLLNDPKVQEALSNAQRDRVAWVRHKNGHIKIWYETESGSTCLNEVLNEASERRFKP
jgi:hypothetical protein